MRNQKKNRNANGGNHRHLPAVIMAVLCLAAFGMLTVMTGCGAAANRVELRIEVKNPSSIEFDKYDKIFYKDLVLKSMPKDFDPTEKLRIFFLDEFASVLEKKVELWDKPKDVPLPPNSVLISGTLGIDVKARSRIKEVEDKKSGALKGRDGSGGKKKRVFVAVQHWAMDLTVVVKENDTGKELFKKDLTAKLANAEPETTKYNFEDLFFKISNRLVRRLVRTRKMQRRFLML